MATIVRHVDVGNPDPEAIAEAASVLKAGGLVAFPTETVYGLGAHALDEQAVKRIFMAKGRPANNPLIVHTADAALARALTSQWPADAALLAEHFWPGPLTLVLPRTDRVPDLVTAGGPTVALRVPGHPVALALLRACEVPVAAPSANRSGMLSPTLASHVLADLEGPVDMLLDAGAVPGGIESTVLDLTARPPRLLRPGLVTPVQLEALIGPVVRAGQDAHGAAAKSPGLQERHYAPRTPLERIPQDRGAYVRRLCEQGLRVGWLTFNPHELALEGAHVKVMPLDPNHYAARLYAVLHELDAAGIDRIVVDLPPLTDDWLAIHDRLRRAGSS